MKLTNTQALDVEKVSVITETMNVIGDVTSDCMIILEGSIQGTITTKESFESYVDSKVNGNIHAKAALLGGELIGNVTCEETINVDLNTSVNGNLEANTITIAGIVNGDVHAKDILQLKASAQVNGHITCALVSIEEGARIDGSFKMVKKVKESPVLALDRDDSIEEN